MNRRQKIIVSVTGIFLVLLILLGLTYAYFLTRITGNDKDKSISVKTANLSLVYGDGNGVLEVGELIEPGDTVKFKDGNGNYVDSKTFTVTNNGNATTDYVVVIENVNVTYTNTVEVDGETHTAGSTTTFESNDFVYTLTCESGCEGAENAIFPINGGILVGNSIDVSEEQTYELTLKYLETGKDQSKDMNKTMTAKINIADITTVNPYSDNTNSLAYNIINNSITGANGTTLASVPISGVATSVSGMNYTTSITESTSTISSVDSTYGAYYWTYADGYTVDSKNGFTLTGVHTCQYSSCYADLEGKYLVSNSQYSVGNAVNFPVSTTGLTTIYKVITAGTSATSSVSLAKYTISTTTVEEKVLSVAQDDYGTSYYYRGDVEDNYVNFAGMCWRIVRIEGDGSIKLILEDGTTECNNSSYTGNWSVNETMYGDDNLTATNFSYGGLSEGLRSFQLSKLSNVLGKLKSGDWCYDDTVTVTYELCDIWDADGVCETYYTEGIYETYNRIVTNKAPSLVCTGTKLTKYADDTNMYVGTLTADEAVFAGASYEKKGNTNYLMNDYNEDKSWWLISPASFSTLSSLTGNVFNFYDFRLNYTIVGGPSLGVRPAVSLVSNVNIVSGDGTISNPYVIN